LFFIVDSYAQTDWKLGKDKEGIKVYTRKVDGYKLKQVKAETVVQANIKVIKDLIADFDNHSKWVDNCAISKIVETKSENECFFYNTYTTPWPAKDRDVITHIIIDQKSEDRVYINFDAAPDYMEEKEGYVRVPYSEGSWDLKKIDDNNTEIVYKIHVDSGGSIPRWMINELILRSPFRTIRSLKNQVEPKIVE
jgi:hypothetical protein